MVGISVLAGIIALVFAIVFYVKFFQMAADINRMSRLMEELAKKNKVVSLKKETPTEQSQESASASSVNVNTDATKITESISENDDVFSKIGWPTA